MSNVDDIAINPNNLKEKEKSISMEIGYLLPFWTSPPLHKYTLEVWREGTIIGNIDIDKKEFYLFGRNKTICDVYLNNITASRCHCVLQHKDDGSIYIYDLDSVYGTYVNKRQIAKKTYVKLNIFDTFKIGKSEKMFILNGPSDLINDEADETNVSNSNLEEGEKPQLHFIDRKELLKKRENVIKEQYHAQENYKRELLNRRNETWGQKDYDTEIYSFLKEEEEENKFNNNINGDNNDENDYGKNINYKERKDLTEKQKGMVNKIENIQRTIKNLKEEIINIKKKEADTGELSQNQKHKLEKNEKRLTDLFEQLEQTEDNLKISMAARDGEFNTEHKFSKELAKELSEDDEFYDRVKDYEENKNKSNNLNQVTIVENFETLKLKLENLIRTRQKLTDKLQNFDFDNNEQKLEKDDTLDEFFKDTETNFSSNQKEAFTQKIAKINEEIIKTQRLVSLVTPSHIKIKFNNINKASIPRIKDDNNDNQKSSQGFSRDQETLDSFDNNLNKKKKIYSSITDSISQFSKIHKRFESEVQQRKYDSDEEIIDNVEKYKEQISKGMEQQLAEKGKEFKDFIAKTTKSENLQNAKGGLVVNDVNNSNSILNIDDSNINKDQKTVFEEIIGNISNTEFDINKYQGMTEILSRKNESKRNKIQVDINFNEGGIQTFEKNDQLTGNKRQRDQQNDVVNSTKVYGTSVKPINRNAESEEIDYDDYDAFNMPNIKKEEHDVSVNPLKKYADRNLDDF